MIVFDSSTLILVTKIDLLDVLLEKGLSNPLIPVAVEQECCLRTKTFDALLIQQRIDESKIKTLAVKNRKMVASLERDFNLGRGEAEALVLALQERAGIVAIDDKNGINACKLLNLGFTTAIALLVRSCQNSWLTKSDALIKLEGLCTFGRYADSILEDAKTRVEKAT